MYLALRAKEGGDKDLEAQFDRKVNVHELNKNIDNNFLAAGDPKVTIIGTISSSSTLDLSAYKLAIRTGGETLRETASYLALYVVSREYDRCRAAGLLHATHGPDGCVLSPSSFHSQRTLTPHPALLSD